MPRKPPQFADHPIRYATASAVGMVRACCCHVVDGDTADFLLDLGWYQYAYVALRFRGINTAETRGTRGAEAALAKAAKQWVCDHLLGSPALLRGSKQKVSFQRFVADIWIPATPDMAPSTDPEDAPLLRLGNRDWKSVADLLVAEGLAERVPR
ncbi:MAG: hypothetical protein ACPG77_04505 [Nannocystaceae bacterium]